MSKNKRDLTLLVTMATLLGVAAVVVLWNGTTTVQGATLVAPRPPEPQATDAATPAALVVDTPTPAPLSSTPATRKQTFAANMTSGIITGEVALSAAIAGGLQSVNITIEEAIEGPGDPPRTPFVKTHVEPVGRATPSFTYTEIPFSEYGYWVRVWAKDVNGSRRFVRITKDHPVAEITLAVTEGVPFTVLLRDQQKFPVPDTKVFMVPVGSPPGRELRQQPSDNFGAAIFEGVLSGPYHIRVGSMQAPRNEPTEVHVQMHSGVRSATIELATGREQVIRVTQRGVGRGIEGATVKLLATDSRQLREYEGVTDWGGNCAIGNILPGRYQLDVRAERFGAATRRIKVTEDGALQPVDVQMSLRR